MKQSVFDLIPTRPFTVLVLALLLRIVADNHDGLLLASHTDRDAAGDSELNYAIVISPPSLYHSVHDHFDFPKIAYPTPIPDSAISMTTLAEQ